ncbi:hypothetical protein CH249_14340 [Rhodococcus sp. 05-2255-3B1]|nr:hypothetical protein CH249_14340 [Rhodococcus sp. 05-2255-3B1]OZE17350.1 hypothetical protein CH255_18295 [Rhodococcus sp. 05-2255-2A2]
MGTNTENADAGVGLRVGSDSGHGYGNSENGARLQISNEVDLRISISAEQGYADKRNRDPQLPRHRVRIGH